MQATEKSGALKSREWRRRYVPWLVVLVALAAGLRFGPIAAGLPYIDYVDEGYALHQAIHLLNNRTLDTNWYGYPSLPAYLSAAALNAWKPVYRNVHGHHFRNDLPRQDIVETTSGYNYDLISPPELIVAGRVVAACLSLGTVLLAGTIATRVRGRVAGVLAMLLTALCPALVLRASNLIVDTFATFFALLAVYFCGRIQPNERSSIANAAAAGFAAGLAFASKYTAGAVFGAVIIVIFGLPATAKLRLRLGFIGAGGLLAGIALGAPATFLHWRIVLRDVAVTAGNYRIIRSSPGYFGQAVSAAELGWPLAIAGCVGVVIMLCRGQTRSLVIGWLLFAALLLAAFVTRPFQPFRNLLPLVPMLCIAASIAFSDLLDWTEKGSPRWLRIAGAAAVIFGCAIALAFASLGPLRQRTARTDTRVQAIDWLQQHATKRQSILGIRELAILPAEWKRVPATVTLASCFDAAALLETGSFDYVVTGEFDPRHATDPGRAAASLARSTQATAQFSVTAEFGTGPAFVVPYVWRTNDERIVILRSKDAKSE